MNIPFYLVNFELSSAFAFAEGKDPNKAISVPFRVKRSVAKGLTLTVEATIDGNPAYKVDGVSKAEHVTSSAELDFTGTLDIANTYTANVTSQTHIKHLLKLQATMVGNNQKTFVSNAIFFEFRPVEQEGYDNLLTIDQLEVGKDYEIILTNLSGFYRYKIKDVVRVTGMHNTLPEITFKYRLNQTVNLTGEKTTEEALRESVKQCEEKYGFDCVDFTVFADTEAVPMNYNFLIEPDNIDDIDVEALRADLEKNLGKANPSFGSKIENNTFGETKLEILQKETFMLYRDLMAMKGVSVVQLKPPRIIVNEVQRKFFYALREL